jgi:hypothetical protein
MGQLLKLTKEELVNLALRLEKAIEIEKYYKSMLREWEDLAERRRVCRENLPETEGKVREMSRVLAGMGEEIHQIMELKEVQVHNLEEMRRIAEECEEHIAVANKIVDGEQLGAVCQNEPFKNQQLRNIVKHLNEMFSKAGNNS